MIVPTTRTCSSLSSSMGIYQVSASTDSVDLHILFTVVTSGLYLLGSVQSVISNGALPVWPTEGVVAAAVAFGDGSSGSARDLGVAKLGGMIDGPLCRLG